MSIEEVSVGKKVLKGLVVVAVPGMFVGGLAYALYQVVHIIQTRAEQDQVNRLQDANRFQE